MFDRGWKMACIGKYNIHLMQLESALCPKKTTIGGLDN